MQNKLPKYFRLSGVISIILTLISDNVVQTDANFKSNPTTVKAYESDSILLPCYAKEPHFSVRWINEDNKLVADSRDPTYQLPNRILYANGSLSVLDVKVEDTGDYICEVNIGDNRVIKQINSIEVQVAPQAKIFPTGVVNITLGAIFQAVCEVKGVPHPIIRWVHNGQTVTALKNKRFYTVDVRTYNMSGKIECVAENGVGPAASAALQLVVNFAPKIEVKEPIVHTAPGVEAKIDCFVNSYPDAKVHWFHNGMPVRKTNLISMTDSDLSTQDEHIHYSKKRHTLKIRNVKESDFGRYDCKAENAQGMATNSIEMMGKPLPPTFDSKTAKLSPTILTISWETKSLSPILDYIFRFRQVLTGNEDFSGRRRDSFQWKPLIIPADKENAVFHTKTYTLNALNASTVYEMTVTARNQFGNSENSKILRFSTPGKIVDGINNAPGGLNENDMNYDEHPFSNEIYNSAYNVATRASHNMNGLHAMLCFSAFALAVAFHDAFFTLPLQQLL